MASAPTRRVMASSPGQRQHPVEVAAGGEARARAADDHARAPPGRAANASTASTMARAVSASKAFICLRPIEGEVRHARRSIAVIRRRSWRRSHPEDAELGRPDRLVHRRRQAERQRRARVGRIEDAVVPQPRRRVVGMALAVVLLADRLLEGLLLVLRPAAAPAPRCCRAARWRARWPPARRPSPRCARWATSTGSAGRRRGRTCRSCRRRSCRR